MTVSNRRYSLPNKHHDVVDDINELRTTFRKIDADIQDIQDAVPALSETISEYRRVVFRTEDDLASTEIQNIGAKRYLVVNQTGDGVECLEGGGDVGGKRYQCSVKRSDENYDTAWGDILNTSKNGMIVQENSETSNSNETHIFVDETEIENNKQTPKVELTNCQAKSDLGSGNNSSVIICDEIGEVENEVQVATNLNYGLIKVGNGFTNNEGTISAPIITTATENNFGIIRIGNGLVNNNGVISRDEPTRADFSDFGVVKLGKNLKINSSEEMEIDEVTVAPIYDLGNAKICNNGIVDLNESVLRYRLLVTSDLVIQINENFVPIQDYTFILELISDGTHLVAFSDRFKGGMTELPINRGTTKLKISKKLGVPYYEAVISRLDAPAPVLLTSLDDFCSKFLVTAPKGGSWQGKSLCKNSYDGFCTITELNYEFFTLVCVDYVNYLCRSSSVAMNKFIFEGSNDNKNWTTLIHKENQVCYGKNYTERKGCFRYYKLSIGYSGDDNKPGGVMLFGTEIDNNECEITNLTPYMASNITPYATLTASSTPSGSAANITDGDMSTYMRVTSVNGSRWIKYELTEPAVANMLELNFSAANNQTNWFKLEGSNDDENWELLLERQYPTNTLFNNGVRVVFYHMTNETAYKYYKLTCLATNDSSDNWDTIGFKLFFINRGNGKPYFYSLVPTLSSNSQDGYEVTTSSNYNDSHLPFYVFDNNASTKWGTKAPENNNPEWLQIKLPTANICNVVTISARPEGDNIYKETPTEFDIQGSNDGESWDTLTSQTGVTWTSNGQTQSFSFENETAYLYYRILMKNNTYIASGTNKPYSFGEIAFINRIREYKRYLEKYEYLVPAMSSNSQNGYVASADSTYGSDYPARKAFDRSNSSSWTSRDATSTTPHWLKIYNNNGISANCINIMWHSTHYGIDYVISGSNDDETYTDLVTITNNNYLNPSYYLGDIQTFKYWKISVTRINTNQTRTEIHQFNLIKQTIVQEY